MTADREKLREDVARAIQAAINRNGTTADLADAAIALIWPAAMREAAEVPEDWLKTFGHARPEYADAQTWASYAVHDIRDAILALSLPPDAEKEEGR